MSDSLQVKRIKYVMEGSKGKPDYGLYSEWGVLVRHPIGAESPSRGWSHPIGGRVTQ